jgi:hypothetical protein
MSCDCEVDRLVALLEEHELIPDWEDDDLGEGKPWDWGHRLICERVGRTPYFPMSVAEVRALLEMDDEGPAISP